MKKKSGQVFRTAAVILLFLAVSGWMLVQIEKIEEQADLISLEYPDGSVTETGFEQWKKSEGVEMVSEAAVWKKSGEAAVCAAGTGRERRVSCYRIKGQPYAVFGKSLVSGRYFTGDEKSCLLDLDTVRSLFGSDQVLGMEIRMKGQTWRVAGILEGNGPICVVPAEEETVFDGVTVRKKNAGQSSGLTVSLLEAVFGGTHEPCVDGKVYAVTAWLLYGAAAAGVFLAAGRRMQAAHMHRAVSWLCIMAAAGTLIWGITAADPGSDYLPSYWSDFDFFVRLFREKSEQIQGLFAHQEFACWQSLPQVWTRVVWTGVFTGAIAVCFPVGREF